MSVFKRGKFYHFRRMYRGELYYGSTGETSRSAAQTYEDDYMRAVRNGTLVRAEDIPTLEEFSATFFRYVASNQNMKPTTRKFYHWGWRILESTPIAKKRITEIRTPDSETLEFGQRKAGSANQALRTLKRMLSHAAELGILQAVPKIKMRKEERRERIIAPWEEALLLESATPTIRDMLVLMLDSGMRPNEISRMRWEDVRWDGNTVLVQRGKTGAARRYVPLTNRMRSMLQERKARNSRLDRQAGRIDSPWVFPAPRSKEGHMRSNQAHGWARTIARSQAAPDVFRRDLATL